MRKFSVDSPVIHVILVDDFWKNATTFDTALSYSNFEHDGLGHYGDPHDPEGDIKAMREMWSIIKPNGHLILAVPFGYDCIRYNLHRHYGPIRLPWMLHGWIPVAAYHIDPRSHPCGDVEQGALVLRRNDNPMFNPTGALWKLLPQLMKLTPLRETGT